MTCDKGHQCVRVKSAKMYGYIVNGDGDGKLLSVGTIVESDYKGRGRWYPGRIANITGPNIYSIDYDDGDNEKDVDIDRIRFPDGQKARDVSKESTVDSTKDSSDKKCREEEEGCWINYQMSAGKACSECGVEVRFSKFSKIYAKFIIILCFFM